MKAHVADAANGVAGEVQVLARSESGSTSEELACQDPAPGAVPSMDGYAFTMQGPPHAARIPGRPRRQRAACRVVAPVDP